MAFIAQGQVGGNSCGAICYCYLQWLLSGRNPNAPNQNTGVDCYEIQQVHRLVQFGSSKPPQIPDEFLPRDYCDPVKIHTLLQLDPIRQSLFYISPASSMIPVFFAMQSPYTPEEYYIQKMQTYHLLKHEDLPLPKDGEYAIAVFDVLRRDILQGQHYLLFQKAGTQLYRFNPWDGAPVGCTGYEDFQAEGCILKFAHAGLLVHPVPVTSEGRL